MYDPLLSLSKTNFRFQPISSWNSYSHKDASSGSSSKKDLTPLCPFTEPHHIFTQFSRSFGKDVTPLCPIIHRILLHMYTYIEGHCAKIMGCCTSNVPTVKVAAAAQYTYQDSKLLASLIEWYIRFFPGWSGAEIKCMLL